MVCTVQEEEGQQEEKDTTSPSENSTDIVDLASSPEPEKIGKILRVVLTGGPNGGKTTATQVIPALLRPDSDLNFPKVLTIPEAATLIMEMGVNRTEELGLNDKKLLAFQEAVMEIQTRMEDTTMKLARKLASCGENRARDNYHHGPWNHGLQRICA